jgi:hypothetical protein
MHPPVHLVGADDGKPSFLVFITRDLDRAAIESSLARFMALTARGPSIPIDGDQRLSAV